MCALSYVPACLLPVCVCVLDGIQNFSVGEVHSPGGRKSSHGCTPDSLTFLSDSVAHWSVIEEFCKNSKTHILSGSTESLQELY